MKDGAPMKIVETTVSDVFTGYRSGKFVENGLKHLFYVFALHVTKFFVTF